MRCRVGDRWTHIAPAARRASTLRWGPSIAREEVIRALHTIFGRPPGDLPLALGLWERAVTERTARNRVPAPPPAGTDPVPVPPPAPGPPPAEAAPRTCGRRPRPPRRRSPVVGRPLEERAPRGRRGAGRRLPVGRGPGRLRRRGVHRTGAQLHGVPRRRGHRLRRRRRGDRRRAPPQPEVQGGLGQNRPDPPRRHRPDHRPRRADPETSPDQRAGHPLRDAAGRPPPGRAVLASRTVCANISTSAGR